MELLFNYGYAGIFISAFLAATLLPLSSEVVLGLLLYHGYNPFWVIATATIGNVAGSTLNYGLGYWGSLFLIRKILHMNEDEFNLASTRLQRYGKASLLFAWMPVIGDPLTVAAGILKINFFVFLIFVTVGKALRYLIIGYPFF